MHNQLANDHPILHVYASSTHHDDAHLAGSRAGLVALRDAITAVLATDQPSTTRAAQVFASDGEGYALFVIQLADTDAERLANHYSDPDIAKDPGTVYPWEMGPVRLAMLEQV